MVSIAPVTGQEQKVYYLTAQATSTGAKYMFIQPPKGKIWRILGAQAIGAGDGNTTTNRSSYGIRVSTTSPYALSRVSGLGSFSGINTNLIADLTLATTTTDMGGTAGSQFTLDSTDQLLWVCPGTEFILYFNVSAKVSNENYMLLVFVEEYDI